MQDCATYLWCIEPSCELSQAEPVNRCLSCGAYCFNDLLLWNSLVFLKSLRDLPTLGNGSVRIIFLPWCGTHNVVAAPSWCTRPTHICFTVEDRLPKPLSLVESFIRLLNRKLKRRSVRRPNESTIILFRDCLSKNASAWRSLKNVNSRSLQSELSTDSHYCLEIFLRQLLNSCPKQACLVWKLSYANKFWSESAPLPLKKNRKFDFFWWCTFWLWFFRPLLSRLQMVRLRS